MHQTHPRCIYCILAQGPAVEKVHPALASKRQLDMTIKRDNGYHTAITNDMTSTDINDFQSISELEIPPEDLIFAQKRSKNKEILARSRENHQKKQAFVIPTKPPKIPGKEGKNARKNKEILGKRRKKQGIPPKNSLPPRTLSY